VSEVSIVVSQTCLACQMLLYEGNTSKASPNFHFSQQQKQVAGMNLT